MSYMVYYVAKSPKHASSCQAQDFKKHLGIEAGPGPHKEEEELGDQSRSTSGLSENEDCWNCWGCWECCAIGESAFG